MPLASLAQTDSPPSLLAQIAEKIAKIQDRVEKQNIAGCTEILAGLRFGKNLIRQFLQEDIMQESVIYQDIVQSAEFKFFYRLLNRRFGAIDSSIIAQIRELSTEQLEILGEAFLDFSSIADLEAWLDQATNK